MYISRKLREQTSCGAANRRRSYKFRKRGRFRCSGAEVPRLSPLRPISARYEDQSTEIELLVPRNDNRKGLAHCENEFPGPIHRAAKDPRATNRRRSAMGPRPRRLLRANSEMKRTLGGLPAPRALRE